MADILKERNARISEGSHWLVWNEDHMLGCWQIYQAGRGKGVVIFEDPDESAAVAEFLRLTDDQESEAANG